MAYSHLVGVLFALTSALVWGSGDFSGGVATRRNSQFQVLAISTLSGMVILVVLAAVLGEWLPSPRTTMWALPAGVLGAMGVAALYRGLSLGNAASVAPTAAVVGAALPVTFSAFVEGLPEVTQLTGFATALVGIWLVTRSPEGSRKVSRPGFLLAVLAGFGFGGFFILIAQVEPGAVFAPLIVARGAAFCVAVVPMLLKGSRLPSLGDNPIALLAGVLDTGGNVFYLLAQQFTRLDVAAVLSSLYPATTVILARTLLKEDVSRAQWAGITLCLSAVALIAI